MIVNKIDIIEYIEQLLGQAIHLQPLNVDQLQGLALYLRKGYELYQIKVLEQDLVLAIPKSEVHLSPTQASKVLKVFSSKLQKPIALVLSHLPAFLRGRYVSQRVPFLVPGKQLFLPNMFIDLRFKEHSASEARLSFRPATQCMLIYHLLVESINGMLQEDVADRLGYSRMTISRAVTECRDKELILSGPSGVQFAHSNTTLWRESQSFLKSPIRKTIYADEVKNIESYMISGAKALAHYTALAPDEIKSIAISQKQYRELNKQEFNLDANFGKIRIEIWEYDPKLLSNTHHVDPVSLYLSLYDENNDDRTSMALDQLLINIHD